MEKFTYASLGKLGETFHQSFDKALSELSPAKIYPLFISGKAIKRRETFADLSPADRRRVIARFSMGTANDVSAAVNAAKRAFTAWRDLGWQRRCAFVRKAAAIMTERQFELAAILTLEVGKNRFEAIAEVSEAIDLLLYYADQMEINNGYEIRPVTEGTEQTKSILKPYGVWAVVSPFNFPLALATGMAAGALVAGNTVVFKPASDTPLSDFCLYEILSAAGIPPAAFNFITGPGSELGEALVNNPDLDGFIFTGSRSVGLRIGKQFQHGKGFPRPCITELGGKNPAIVMPSANIDDATEGVMRSAFGMGGQKCSACSRVYVHGGVYDAFVESLVERTKKIEIGDPADRDTFLGPLINEGARDKYRRAVKLGRQGRIVYGGNVLRDANVGHGYFVEPAIVDRLPTTSKVFQEEFFAPAVAISKVKSLAEAIQLANDVEYGLTAGIFTNDPSEQKQFFNEIEAGVTYCNRRGGATTGAWPGIQSFGGWKASGSSGKNALGPHYVAQFMREQSQTVVNK